MPKSKTIDGQITSRAFQEELDSLDVVGNWEWDAASDLVRVDGAVALLFNLDPKAAEEGTPLPIFLDAIHSEDLGGVLDLIRQSARERSLYLAEYRVCSADDQIRWVIARGRFTSDYAGLPRTGRGILIDITRMRLSETAPDDTDWLTRNRPLDLAAEHTIAAQKAISALEDPDLKNAADALLMSVGRKLAQHEMSKRRKRMN